jgi:uncharacterized protein (UPF0305 family)
MAPWDEPFPITYCISRTLLQMEANKYIDEAIKYMMNLIRELSQESIEEKIDEAPLTEKPLQMKKHLKNKSVKKVTKKTPMNFLTLKTHMRQSCPLRKMNLSILVKK